MKATKQLKEAIEFRLNLTEKDYEVMKMARIFEDQESYDVAVVNIIVINDAYIVRTWKKGGVKIRQISPKESYSEAFKKFILLEE